MASLQLLAQPWWVNLLILVPISAYVGFRRVGLSLDWPRLATGAAFAAAFGFVEAAVVVYLRAAGGLLPGYLTSLAAVRSSILMYDQSKSLNDFPQSLMAVEVWREAATLAMLISVAILSGARNREKLAMFLWVFAIWDSAYYAGLWATVRWPASLLDLDVLFLIPVPWLAQVWFPLLISVTTVVAIALNTRSEKPDLGR
ncbi:MAG TPA: hypothetical protein VH437_07195 [Terriglobales bacterium]|jgi:hypothetical protein